MARQTKEEISARKKAYYAAHRAEILAGKKAYNETNRAAISARKKAAYAMHREETATKSRAHYAAHRAEYRTYRIANRAKNSAKNKAYAAAHRAEIAAQKKAYHAAHRDEVSRRKALYKQANIELGRTYTHNRRARVHGNGGRHTTREWRSLCHWFGNVCLRCGASGKLSRDHVLPTVKGGTNNIDNLQPLCKPCNSRKGTTSTDYRDPSLLAAFIESLKGS